MVHNDPKMGYIYLSGELLHIISLDGYKFVDNLIKVVPMLQWSSTS